MYHIKLTASQWQWLGLMAGYALGAATDGNADEKDISDKRKLLRDRFMDIIPLIANAEITPDDPEWGKG